MILLFFVKINFRDFCITFHLILINKLFYYFFFFYYIINKYQKYEVYENKMNGEHSNNMGMIMSTRPNAL